MDSKRTCDRYYIGSLVQESDDGHLSLRQNPIEDGDEDSDGKCKDCLAYKEALDQHIKDFDAARKSGKTFRKDPPGMRLHPHKGKGVFAVGKAEVSAYDLSDYDVIIVAFSGGKDSLACLLHLLDLGVSRDRIELWHHCVDGWTSEEHPDSERRDFADWPITPAYCKQIAEHFRIPLYFSWVSGGFEAEMLLDDEAPAPTYFETDLGTEVRYPLAKTRRRRQMFPQKSSTLADGTRWCTPLLKIDVGKKALTHSKRLQGKNVLFLSGERAQESTGRAFYPEIQAHTADLRYATRSAIRHIDHWRPVHAWDESDVWAIIKKYGIVPHPCYQLGFGRCSCAICIFGNPNQFASFAVVMPARFTKLVRYEKKFGVKIDRDLALPDYVKKGAPYRPILEPAFARVVDLLRSEEWPSGAPIAVPPKDWRQPAGAFGESDGPT